MRLVLCLPWYGGVEPSCALSIAMLCAAWSSAGVGGLRIHTASLSPTQRARDEVTHRAIAAGLDDDDVLLWIDSDMGFDSGEVLRMAMRTGPCRIVGAAGRKRTDDAVVYCCAPSGPMDSEGLVPGEVGGACVAMRGATLKRLYEAGSPYTVSSEKRREVWPCGPVDGDWMGEDIGMCRLAASIGIEVMIDAGVRLEHYGVKGFNGRLSDHLHRASVDGSFGQSNASVEE